ncbi:hypothetical protein [Moritella sp. 36]|nr:hypothetical protein [Moritella sp. 36]
MAKDKGGGVNNLCSEDSSIDRILTILSKYKNSNQEAKPLKK